MTRIRSVLLYRNAGPARQPIDPVVRKGKIDLDVLHARIVHCEFARPARPAAELIVDELDETRADIADDKGVESPGAIRSAEAARYVPTQCGENSRRMRTDPWSATRRRMT